MFQLIKTKATLLVAAFTLFAVPVMAGGVAFAQVSDTDIQNCIAQGVDANGAITDGSCTGDAAGGGGGTTNLSDVLRLIINIFSIIVGFLAVIMIIWGGLRYITSGGDSGKITSAKNTIIYAILGLIIVALAQFIVRFVLAKASEVA